MARTALLLIGVLLAIAVHSLLMVSDPRPAESAHPDIAFDHQMHATGPLDGSASGDVCPDGVQFVAPRVEFPSATGASWLPLPAMQEPSAVEWAAHRTFLRPGMTCALFQVFRL